MIAPQPLPPSQGSQPPAPAGASLSAGPGLAPPAAPPVPPALIQYQQAMQQYASDMAEWKTAKQNLISQALQLLRQDKLRGFRIDIETDSTIQQDATEDKQARVEFVAAMAGMLDKGMQAGMADPEIVPLVGKMLLFAARGFRTGRELEAALEEYVDDKEKVAKATQGQPKPPDPKVQAQQVQAQADMQRAQAEIAKAKIDAQASADDNQREMAQKQADAQLAQQKMQMEMQQMQRDAQMREQEFAQRMAELQMQMKIAEQNHIHKVAQMHAQHTHQMAQYTMQPNGIGSGANPGPGT